MSAKRFRQFWVVSRHSPGQAEWGITPLAALSCNRLFGACEQHVRNIEAERLHGLAVDDELELVGCSMQSSVGLAPLRKWLRAKQIDGLRAPSQSAQSERLPLRTVHRLPGRSKEVA